MAPPGTKFVSKGIMSNYRAVLKKYNIQIKRPLGPIVYVEVISGYRF